MHHVADEGMRRALGLTFAKRKHDRFDADFQHSAFTPELRREIADEEREERFGSDE